MAHDEDSSAAVFKEDEVVQRVPRSGRFVGLGLSKYGKIRVRILMI